MQHPLCRSSSHSKCSVPQTIPQASRRKWSLTVTLECVAKKLVKGEERINHTCKTCTSNENYWKSVCASIR